MGPQDPLATVDLRWTDPERGSVEELKRDIRTNDLARSFEAADPYFRFDAIVAATDEVHGFLDLLDRMAAMDR